MHLPLVESLDVCRASVLRLSLRPKWLRRSYRSTPARLSLGMALTYLIFLPVALCWPQLLLVAGPLIFGYAHLVASYRYTQGLKSYAAFVGFTALAVALHLSGPLHALPFGTWQLMLATLALVLTKPLGPARVALTLGLCALLVRLAWIDPVVFVGGSLILHNWVGFLHWIRSATEPARRRVAVLSTFAFGLLHLLVLCGGLDALIPQVDGLPDFEGSARATGWYLASWSSDPLVWYRLLVLYAFGLSAHYFVWLRAIPESLSPHSTPNSFRRICRNLVHELGGPGLKLTVLAMIGATLLWAISRPLGARLYFEVALLHGALELMALACGTDREKISAPCTK